MTSFPTGGEVVATVVVGIDVDVIDVDASFYLEGVVNIIFSFRVVTVADAIFGVNFGAKTQPL